MRFNIRDRRKKMGISQMELIKRSGISKATISAIENGADIDVKVSTLRSLASALECSISSLFD